MMFSRVDSRQFSPVEKSFGFLRLFLGLLYWHVDLVGKFYVHNANKDQKVGIIII